MTLQSSRTHHHVDGLRDEDVHVGSHFNLLPDEGVEPSLQGDRVLVARGGEFPLKGVQDHGVGDEWLS